jgi:DNA mismatch repair protein MutS2
MNPELQALEFDRVIALIARGAKLRGARNALENMHPWDDLKGLRRLHQQELMQSWSESPQNLSMLSMDEALDALFTEAWLQPEHWRQLRDALASLAITIRSVRAIPWPADQRVPEGVNLGIDRLQVMAELLADPSSIAEELKRCFDVDGQLDPLRVPGLSALHRVRQNAFQKVQQQLQKQLRAVPEAFSESTIVERNGRFCLPVRSERKGSVGGLVLDRSGSGATFFLEPLDCVPLNNDFVEAESAYREAVRAFLRELIQSLRDRQSDFAQWTEFGSRVDQALALLRWQSLCEGTIPELNSHRLCLLDARHPMLLPKVREAMGLDALDHPVVPLNLVLDSEKPSLVISGSNTGGKTVVLKTVGLLSALAACGCAVPASPGTQFPPLQSLHADIGDHQTLASSLSTFSSHIVHLKHILTNTREGGLVLLDELGTGTDPREGAALGIAMLHALSRLGARVLCSTHLADISRWALRHQRFQNASVQFDEEKLEPTYRLLLGLPGQSRALTVAAKLGLPEALLKKAESVLGQREQDWRDFLRELEIERQRILEQAEELQRREIRIQKDQAVLQNREEALREEREKSHREAQEKITRVLDFLDHEGKRLVKELKAKEKEGAALNADRVGTETRERLKTMEQIATRELATRTNAPSSKTDPASIRQGGFARHRGLGVEGKVIARKGDRVTLETPQGRRFECRVAELEHLRVKDSERRVGSLRVRAESLDIDRELNLIGRASDEIDSEVYRFVESALASGEKFIRIVHGHGTGRLKQAVRQALRGHPGIQSVEDAAQNQGGAGATLITLR